MNEQVPQRTGRCHGTLCCRTNPIFARQQQRGTVTSPYADIATVGKCGHTLGVSLKLAPLHLYGHTHYSELFQTLSQTVLCGFPGDGAEFGAVCSVRRAPRSPDGQHVANRASQARDDPWSCLVLAFRLEAAPL